MLVLVATTWLLGRALFGPTPGLAAAAGLAATPFMVEASAQVWPDVPGAAVGLGAIAVAVFATAGGHPSWGVLAVPLLVAGATFLRYGAPLQLLAGLGAVGIWRWRVVARGPLPVALAAALSVVSVWVILAVPRATGSGVAPLESIGNRRRRWFEGFGDYLGDGGRVLGTIAGLLLVCGLVLMVLDVVRGDGGRGARLAVLAAGAATFVVTAAALHGEWRYLSPTMPWLWIAAGAGLATALRWVPRPAAPWLGIALAAAVIVAAVRDGDDVSRFNAEQFNTVVDAAEAIDDLAGERSCGVVTGFVPQVAWYSGCRTGSYNLEQVAYPAEMVRTSDVVYLLWAQEGKRQPGPGLWQDYVAESDGLVHREGGGRIVEVYLTGAP
jgi:hypothetical protein